MCPTLHVVIEVVVFISVVIMFVVFGLVTFLVIVFVVVVSSLRQMSWFDHAQRWICHF